MRKMGIDPMNTYRAPKGLEIVESCITCKFRQDRLFCKLNAETTAKLDQMKYSTALPPGAVIFSQGQPPRGVNIVCQGKVKLSMTSLEGKTITIKVAQEGEVLGLSATITGQDYDFTAETVTHCQLNFVRRDDFLRFLQQNQDACFHAAQELSALHSTTCAGLRLFGLAPTVGARLATLLLKWDEDGPKHRRGRITFPYTHEQIAQRLGASRETVTRLLLDLKKRKILEVDGSIAVIRNRILLEQVATGVTSER